MFPKMKRLISMMLAVLMLVTTVPVDVLATSLIEPTLSTQIEQEDNEIAENTDELLEVIETNSELLEQGTDGTENSENNGNMMGESSEINVSEDTSVENTEILTDSVLENTFSGESAEENRVKTVRGVYRSDSFNAAVTMDGSLYLWGENYNGQIGNGTTEDQLTPVKVLSDVVSVSLGDYHSAAITKDKSLYLWGANYYGQIGNGTTEDQLTPVKVLSNVTSVSLGGTHSSAITEDGSLYLWGQNSNGEIGNGTTENQTIPEKVLSDVVSVNMSDTQSAAITEDGSLYIWGYNYFGQIGNGTTENQCVPVKILSDIKVIELGWRHNAAISENGNLYLWGQNSNGEIGNGTTETQLTPVQVLSNVISVSLGGNHSGAVTEDGNLYMWGDNWYHGQIGNGTIEDQLTPVKILSEVVTVSLGWQHSAAITEDGNLYLWGENGDGQIGDGSTEVRHTPIKVLSDVKFVDLNGGSTSAAITEDESLYLWGLNLYGQIGNGTMENQLIPYAVFGSFHSSDADDDSLTYKLIYEIDSFNNSVTITGYEGTASGDLIIPDEIDGYKVTKIASHAFYDCREFIGKLQLSINLTDIGSYTFYNCTGLYGELQLPLKLSYIGDGAFENCNGLYGELIIPKDLTEIGASTFCGCSGFDGKLEIPNGVIRIGSSAFEGCSGLNGNLIIPNSVKRVEDDAFKDCSGFDGILSLSSQMNSIASGTFDNCSGLVGELVIPNNIEYIGMDAFDNCSGLTGNLIIPNSVITIGSRAFNNCSGFIGDLIIPKRITNVEYGVFSGCSGFDGKLEIPNGVISIGPFAFEGCNGLTGNLNIPESVTEIDSEAFCNCSGLTGNLVIPNSVTTIGSGAFIGCNGFEGDLIVPKGITHIGHRVFNGCSGFDGKLEIPNGVISIGRFAFNNCSGLTGNLNIPESVTEIDEGSFWGCSSLTGKINLPKSLNSIGRNAFGNWDSLLEINYRGTKEEWEKIEGVNEFDETVVIKYNNQGEFVIVRKILYFKTWDSENKIAYFGLNDITGSQVTDETDISFMDNLNSMLGKYVLVECIPRDDGLIAPDTLLSIKSVDTKFGVISSIDSSSVVINEETYSITENIVLSESYKNKFVLYHTCEKNLVGLEVLEVNTGVLKSWNSNTQNMSIAPNDDTDPLDYMLSKSATIEAKEFLDKLKNYDLPVKYVIDKMGYIYDIYEKHSLDTEESRFNEYIYRTDYLLDKNNPSNLEYYTNYINKFSPAQTFTEVNKLECANELWRKVTLVLDTAADISALSEYHFDQEDVYTTIIINALEESTSYKMLDSTAKTIASDSTKIVGHIVDILKSEYNIDLGVSEGYGNLSYEKKKLVYEVLGDSLKDGAISGIVTSLDEAGKYIDEFIDASDCIESFVNNVLTYANIYSITDSMADVLDEMYVQAPDDSEHLYMRRALQSCSDLIRASKDDFLNEIMVKGAWTSAGRYMLKKTMSFFWDKLKNAAITADPALGFLLACYKGSRTITDKLCNIDDVSEQSYKLSVIKQYYTILNDTATALTRKYKSSVSEKNAEAVLSSLILLFEIANEDCDIAEKYIDVIEDAAIRDILSFLQIGNSDDADNYAAAHEYIKNIRSEYNQARQNFETEWIYQLESDFPQWYEQYKELIGEKQPLAVPVASYAIECPVNVSVYNDEGAIVAYLRDNKSYATGNVTVSCYENKKYVDVYDDEQYHIVCDGYDTGTMDVFVTEYEEENEKRQVAFYDLIVERNKIFELQREEIVPGEEEYIIVTEDVEIAADYDSYIITENAQVVHVKIEGGYIETLDGPKFELDAYPGERLALCAYIPEGNTFLGWYSNGEFLSEKERCEFVVSDTVKLTAVVEGLSLHKINYFDNDEPMNLEPRTFLESEYVNLPMPKKEGHKFNGWYLTADLSGESITEITVGTREDVTLYASWKSVSQYEEYVIENIDDYIYTGTQIKPLPVVYDNETVLKFGKDYTLSYRNNTKVGTAQIIIKGEGNYTKTATVEFEILPKDISEDDISITCADKLYNGKKQVSKPSVKWNKKTLKAGTDYTVRYSGNQIAPGEVTVTLTGKGNYTGVVETSYRITDKDISKAVIDKLSAQNYTGVEIEPEVVLYANKTAQKNGEALIQGIDYEVKYENNVKSGKGKIVITGINAYGGTKTVAFTINKRTIVNEDVEITFAESDSMEFYATYTGVAQKPQIVIIDQGQMLEEGLDYKLSYANNTKAATVDSKNKPTVTITGMGNYSGTKKVYFNILPMDFLEKDDLKITVTDAKYTGKAVKPAVKVNIGDKTLKKDSDYKVVGYYNNVDLCEKYQSDAAYVVVKGINNYSGEMMVPFRIYAAPASLFVVDKITAQAYTPHEVIEPEIFVYEDKAGQKDGILLTEGIDYEIVDYVNNDKAGTAKVTVTGIGQYGGTKTISFTINKCNLATEGIHVEVEEPVLTYTGNSLKSLVSVVDGDMELIEGVDYTVTYSNNKNVPKNNKNLPTIVIKGKGNYTGTLKETFAIEPKNIADDSITVTAKDVLFSAKSANSSKGHTTTITVMDGVKKLSTSNYKVKGYLNNKLAGDTLDENAPTVLIEGIGNYTGTKEVPFRIFEKNISKVTVEKIPSELYTGKAIEPKPVVTIKLSKTKTITLVEGEDYTITYDKNVKIGKAKVTIIGMGEYGGSKSVTFTILPKWLKWFA